MRKYLLARLKEPSTWRGVIAIAAGGGAIAISPDQADQLIGAGLTMIGVINTLRKEQPKA